MSILKQTQFQKVEDSGRPSVHQGGFTLVELMIAMVLGLVIVGGVVSVFLANKQSYRTNEALSQVQDHGRTAFEFLARDIRMAGLNGCVNNGRVANVLNDGPAAGGSEWYADFSNALRGYDENETDPAVTTGTGVAERVNGTDSIQLMGVDGSGFSVESHNPTSANFKINEATTDFADGDIVVVCDPDHAAIMQITNYNSSNVTVVHNSGTGDPGNCSKGLGFPTDCSSTNGNAYQFGPNSQIAKLSAGDWYIGNNPEGGQSLYRVGVSNLGGVPTEVPAEMVRNVTDMQITYHQAGTNTFVDADAIGAANWAQVDSARVELSLQSEMNRVTTDGQQVVRSMAMTIAIRNRVN